MTSFVIEGLKIVELSELSPEDKILGKVIEPGDNPLIALVNSVASPSDFLWPENQFTEGTIRLSDM